ncbi:MAG: hypothetical protein KF785_07840 [Gemmatimonadales bacterium]|nr:hypothetical protein [Gemmatimonadales bacterium]
MIRFWVFVHLLGMVLWLGGAAGAMAVSIAGRREAREQLATVARLLRTIYNSAVFPGSLAVVVSGLVLTLTMYGSPGAMAAITHQLMTMQVAGLAAALITLIVLVPNSSRLARLDPVSHAAQFDHLRKKQARLGMISGLLGLLALISAVMGWR